MLLPVTYLSLSENSIFYFVRGQFSLPHKKTFKINKLDKDYNFKLSSFS